MSAATPRAPYPWPVTSAPVDRRRLLSGSGAALGLALLAGCDTAPPTTSAAATTTPMASATATPTASGTPTASASPSPSASATAASLTEVEAPRLADAVEDYLDGRSGSLGLELVDLSRGEVFRYAAREAECYSTIKVLVLTTVLRQAQEAGDDLTEREQRLARRMITRSDNAATETLLAQVGRDEVRRVAGLLGMERTEIDDTGWWGLWRTVPGDLNLMVGGVLSSDAVLDGARRAQARFLMADVVPEQRWGVFAAEDDGEAYVAAKNGWGPLPDGYRLNSTGWVTGDGRDYQLSILSNSPAGFSYGRRTISSVARLCHEGIEDGLA